MALTELKIRNAKPGEKPIRIFDGRGKGFYVEVSPKGGKWWRLKYRFEGKPKTLSLGVYPLVSLEEARRRCDEGRRLLATGIDPSQHRKIEKQRHAVKSSTSFEAVSREWYEKHSPVWASGHSTRVLRLFERDIWPWLRNRPITEIAAPELLTTVRRIEARGAGETAHRALSTCGQVFRYAVATGRAERDPSGDLRGALAPIQGGHFAAATEPKHLAKILRQIDAYEGTLIVRSAMRLAPLVFVRPGELRKAEWEHIDLEGAEWRFRTSKTKTDHIVPLSRQAVAILREIHPLTGRGKYVFPSARGSKRPMSDNAVLVAMRTMDIGRELMTGHGFRAAARTILDEVLKVRVDLIEHQLAHVVKDPNGRAYNRTSFLPERTKMMQQWADYLDRLKASADVIPVQSARSA